MERPVPKYNTGLTDVSTKVPTNLKALPMGDNTNLIMGLKLSGDNRLRLIQEKMDSPKLSCS